MPETQMMMLATLMTGGVLAGMGALIVWLAGKSERGTLKRNPIAGVRTALTMSSDSARYPAQRAAAPKVRIAGRGAVVGGITTATLGLWQLGVDASGIILMILAIASVTWLMAWVLAGAASAQRSAQASTKEG